MRIAFATYGEQPHGTRDDALATAALAAHAETPSVPWDGSGFDWTSADAVVLRSCWNYHLRLPEFLSWIGDLEALDVPVLNSGSLVRWNANKAYLRELESQGVRVVPTRWIAPGAALDLQHILGETGWAKAVIKPVVGASSHRTHVVQAHNATEIAGRLTENGAHDGFLFQPFLDEIVTEGEWSLMFFGGRLSHAVIKRPRSGDFRVQWEFEGTAEPGEVDAAVVDQARGILDTLPERPLYARVDGVVRGGTFVLMELELIEPCLFFDLAVSSASRFAECLLGALAAA